MRKLELHVSDMGFLIDEMSTAADKYQTLATMYGGRYLRAITDPEQKAQDRAMVKEFKRREKKARRIVEKMREQKVHWRN